MEIGIDDIDFIDDEVNSQDLTNAIIQDNDNLIIDDTSTIEQNLNRETDLSNPELNSEDLITTILKSKGIEDKSKIKFETEEGDTEEISWDSLDTETKLNILNSNNSLNDELDEAEILLINAVRQSQLTPREYIQYLQQIGINLYLQNSQSENPIYTIDSISDDELFVADFITRTNATEEEAIEALDKAKSNEALFKKLIGAIRSEYQKSEEETIRYNELKRLEEAQEQFNHFAEGVRDQIIDFTEFAGCDLNMDNEDKQELYEFITGFDAAGNSHFGKALNDPSVLVRMAWFALNGEKMIEDINEYYKKEIANVRKESYNKGIQQAKDKPQVIHKTLKNKPQSSSFDDLDDF